MCPNYIRVDSDEVNYNLHVLLRYELEEELISEKIEVEQLEEEWNSRNPVEPYPKNIAEVIIAKHRNGPLGNINLFFNEQYAEFKDMATREIDN